MTSDSVTPDSVTPDSVASDGVKSDARPAKTRGLRKVVTGKVVSHTMDKTLTVTVERLVRHPMYEKFVRKRTKLYVHDEKNEGAVGDVVELMETRRLSKLKRWRLVRVVRKVQA